MMENNMNITSAQYYGHESVALTIKATIDGREYDVPIAEGNVHYQEIMRQVDAGVLTIEPVDMTPPTDAE